MRITKNFSNSYESFQVYPFSEKPNSAGILVSRSKDMEDNWQPAKINWPGCGDSSLDKTKEFIKALEECVYLAYCLNFNLPPRPESQNKMD